jgi:ribosome biogenesis GTPase A
VYGIQEWEDSEDFLKQLCRKTGKLVKGGEPDFNNVSKQIIVDWQRGNIPYFTRPPKDEEQAKEEEKQFTTADPAVQNPIEVIEGETKLTEAQKSILGLLGKQPN